MKPQTFAASPGQSVPSPDVTLLSFSYCVSHTSSEAGAWLILSQLVRLPLHPLAFPRTLTLPQDWRSAW